MTSKDEQLLLDMIRKFPQGIMPNDQLSASLGGDITPEYLKAMNRLIAAGRVVILQATVEDKNKLFYKEVSPEDAIKFRDLDDNSRLARREQQLGSQTWAPVVDMYETENTFNIHAELPGIKKEDISLDLLGDVLTLSGERSEKKKEENERVYRVERERSYGKFSRAFTLPKNADTTNISAMHNNGVLEVQVAKKAPAKPEARKIDIRGCDVAQSK